MIKNKDVLEYFYQTKNVPILEEIINAHFNDFTNLKCSYLYDEDGDYLKINKEISSIGQAQQLMDDKVYPGVCKVLSMDGISKPELRLYGGGFVEDYYSLLKEEKFGRFVGYLTGALEYLGSGNLLSSLIVGGVSGLVSTVGYSLVTMYKRKNTLGYVDNIDTGRIYLRRQKMNSFAFSLAHEITHSVHLQSMSFLGRQYSMLSRNDLICHEGTAHSVAKLVADDLGPIDGLDVFRMHSCPMAICLLANAYHHLYDEMRLPESERKFNNLRRGPHDADEGFEYDIGFSFVQMLYLQHGKEVVRKLVKDEPVNIG